MSTLEDAGILDDSENLGKMVMNEKGKNISELLE
jgi:hypothetical protein